MASNLTGSTLSAAITAPINGSDNALLSVNSCRVVLMQYSFILLVAAMQAKISRQSRIVGEAFIFAGIESRLVGNIEGRFDSITLR